MASKAWWALAVLCLFFLSLASAQNYTSEADRKRVKELATMTNIGGLAGWAAMGHGIRSSALHGWPTAFAINGQIQTQAITTWLAGAIAMLAICLLFSFVTLFFCCCFYCCRSCGACGGSKPRREGYSPFERKCALITMIIGYLLVFIGFVIGLVANSTINTGVDNMTFSIEAGIGDVATIPDKFTATFGTVVTEVETTVDSVFGLIVAVPDQYLGTNGQLTVLVRNTINLLQGVQGTFDVLIAQAYRISNATSNVVKSFETLKSEIDAVTQSLQDLNNPHSDTPGGVVYSLNTTCALNVTFVVVNVTGAIPDFGAQISSISGVNLNTTASFINSTFNNISKNATDLINTQLAGVRAQIKSGLDSANSTVNGQVQTYLSQVSSQASSIQSQVDTYAAAYVTVNNYWRNIVMALLFSLALAPIIICLIGFFFKKSAVMTCAAVQCFCLISLFWILCSIHLIVAAPLGKVCDTYYDKSITQLLAVPPLDTLVGGLVGGGSSNNSNSNGNGNRRRDTSPGSFLNLSSAEILKPHDLNYYINLYYDGMDACLAGGNLIEFLNLTQALNIEGFVNQYIDQANFTGIVNSIDINNVIGNVDFTGGLDLSSISGQLDSLNQDFSVYVTFITNIALNPIIRSINTFSSANTALQSNPAPIQPCITSADVPAATTAVQTKLQSITNVLTSINQTTIHYISGNLSIISTELSSFATSANQTVALALDLINTVLNIKGNLTAIGNAFKNQILTVTIPAGLNQVKVLAADVQVLIVNFTACQSYAEDLSSVINSFCISTIGGLDAVWITCGFLGLMQIVMIVGVSLTAKRMIRADTMDQEYGDDYYPNGGIELPPVYSETDKKA